MASQTVENYLKALFSLANEDNEVNVSELSKYLEVSKPTANSMVKKLNASGLVRYEKYKPLILTAKGRKAAGLIIRKHRLTEMYLVEKMGFGWEQVHEVAEQVEHIKSPLFFDRMDELLGHPSMDPHGSPIPDRDGHIQYQDYDKLSDCDVGDSIKIAALAQSSDELLDFLNKRSIHLGLTIKVVAYEPFDSSMTLQYDGSSQTFSKMVCDSLYVEKV